MKTRIFLLLTISLLTFKAGHSQSNVYHPFVDTNSYWGYCVFGTLGPPPYPSSPYAYFFKGDTIINGITYKKLYRKDYTGITYKGGLREDYVKKRVYIGGGSTKNEFLLYNFSAKIGDTLMNPLGGPARKVDFIDSVQLQNGQYRKVFHFKEYVMGGPKDTLYSYIIEGIGSLNELLGGDVTDQTWTISSYIYKGEILFNNPHNNCGTILEIHETATPLAASINPNPFSLEAVIRLNAPLKDATLTFYNSNGQKVKQINNVNEQTVVFHRDNLPGGLYFYEIISDNKNISSGKLIICTAE